MVLPMYAACSRVECWERGEGVVFEGVPPPLEEVFRMMAWERTVGCPAIFVPVKKRHWNKVQVCRRRRSTGLGGR
jgi:hypothetical protein